MKSHEQWKDDARENGDLPAHPAILSGINLPGMTKRELITMHVAAGLVAGAENSRPIPSTVAAQAANIAEALLVELAAREAGS